jgi:acetyl-CoA acetyltransferase
MGVIVDGLGRECNGLTATARGVAEATHRALASSRRPSGRSRCYNAASMPPSRTPLIVGTGMTPLGKLGERPSALARRALGLALAEAGLELPEVDGLIAVPALAEPRFMEAHALATEAGLVPRRGAGVVVRTVDTGGAGPVTGVIMAARLIERGVCDVVAVVAGDAVGSMPAREFLSRADRACGDPEQVGLPSPCIVHAYDRVARWQMESCGVTREQLAMCAVLMSHQAARHPLALAGAPRTLDEVLASPRIAPVTTLLECARRADGGAAVVLAAAERVEAAGRPRVRVAGCGEGAGPLAPPQSIDESMFSAAEACHRAYEAAGLFPADVDVFELYDCYPVCLVRAVEAAGLCPRGEGGRWIERQHRDVASGAADAIPVTTHGGLLAFGAPWEVPAMYNVIEAVAQLSGAAGARQIPGARRALVYGNGGIFSASAVTILEAL